ncbi:MAG TPA: universal stress protein [Nitrospiria bacterium]|nr:universal stress protein [Nitrospiria bacterium]
MKIVLAVNGSKHSRWAEDFLLALPLAGRPEVTVIHVVEIDPLTRRLISPPLRQEYTRLLRKEVDRSIAEAERKTANLARRLGARFGKVKIVVEKGPAAARIIERARKEKADLIVVGSRGLSNVQGFFIGSVSHKVAMYADCSVLVVKKKTPALKRFLVAVDGSRYADDAVSFLEATFLPKGLRGIVLYVWDEFLYIPERPIEAVEKKYGRALVRQGFETKFLFLTGHAARTIVETARLNKVDLVVVGSRGLTGLTRFLLGGISLNVMERSAASVLIVRRR